MKSMAGPRDEYWREGRQDRKLHLSDERRLAAGKSVIKYFQAVAGTIKPDRHLKNPKA